MNRSDSLRLAARALILAGLILSLLPAATSLAAGPQIAGVTHARRAFATYSEIELIVNLRAQFNNPFDPAQIDLHAQFTSPRRVRYIVNGFYYQDYSLLAGGSGSQQFDPRGQPQWRIRFAAPMAGRWTYRVYARDNTGQTASSSQGSPLTVRAGKSNGFVRVSRKDPRYLAFDSGQSYFAVGENLAWWDKSVLDYDNWITGPGKLHDQRVNFVRIWMAPSSFGIETASPLGNYLSRMGNAWALDHVLGLTERDNIEVLLTLETHANFRDTDTAGLTWSANPYNSVNGGPLQQPCDYFTNPTAIALFKRYLRYVVARWGYSTSILGWELWNEVDLVKDNSGHYCDAGIPAWHATMISALRSLDPYRHLITTSYARGLGDPAVWKQSGIDIVQAHDYNYVQPQTIFTDLAALRSYGKPAWLGEFGLYTHVLQYTSDLQGNYIHDDQWASLMSGAAGSGFPWYWDYYVDKNGSYSAFHALPRFVQRLRIDLHRFSPEQPQIQTIRPGATVRVFVLRGDTVSLLWVHGDTSTGGDSIAPGMVTVPMKASSAFRIHWWDTTQGREISTVTIRPRNGELVLPLPGTGNDYAAKIVQVPHRA